MGSGHVSRKEPFLSPARHPSHADHLSVLGHGADDDLAAVARVEEGHDVLANLVAADALPHHGFEDAAHRDVRFSSDTIGTRFTCQCTQECHCNRCHCTKRTAL